MSEKPYEGLFVVELARVLAGPWIGQTLADLGANVIKIESPDGDDTRKWGPPFLHDSNGQQADAAYFHSCNRGKRSIVADLKSESGRKLVFDLIAKADVFIENFKVGGLRQYGLDYATVSVRHPRLIYCSVSGFGQSGPYAHRPGYDFLSQAMGGIMDLTGDAGGDPQKIGVAFADIFTGLYGLVGVQSALAQRERSGEGQLVDVSLLDSMVGVLANQAMNYLVGGTTPRRIGNVHPNISPYQSFATADAEIVIAVGNNRQFAKLCEVLALTEFSDDARFSSNAKRVQNRAALVEALQAVFTKWPREKLLDALVEAGVPAAPINSLEDVFNDPQIHHREMQLEIPTNWAAGGSIPGIRTPIVFSDSVMDCCRPSPRLDEHRVEILEELYGPGSKLDS